jgi:hypothetical protein
MLREGATDLVSLQMPGIGAEIFHRIRSGSVLDGSEMHTMSAVVRVVTNLSSGFDM